MNCKSYQSLTTREKQALIGELVHIVQSDEYSLWQAKKIIERGRNIGLMDDVTILPATDLNKNEDELRTVLYYNSNSGVIWGEAIDRVLETEDPAKFRDLCQQLRSQAKDNPQAMKDIIGVRAYELLMQGDRNELEVETMGNAIEDIRGLKIKTIIWT